MKTTYLILSILLALNAIACQQQAPDQSVSTPTQEVAQEYGADQTQIDAAREKLTTLHNKIKDTLQTWRDTPAPAGPQFDGEEDALAKEIITDCDSLESEATTFSEQTYVREHGGAGLDLKEMIDFAKKTRDEVHKGKSAR
jgi:hypothetical protein